MKFIIFVIDQATNTATSEEMSAIDSFNEKLQENENWIFAGGLSAPANGNVIDNRSGASIETSKPLFAGQENYSGFWLIEAENLVLARELALEGSKACNRKVELRPLL